MRTNIHFYFNFILFFLVFSAFGQPLNDNYANAIDVTSLINSCSSNAAYTTSGGTPDKIAGVYWNNSGPKYNVWFKFIAPATGQINATIDVGSGKGTQTKTQIAIWQADGLTEVTSKSNVVYGEDVSIGSLVLTPGNTYYISVDAFDASTLGSFTLCLQSTVDYDFYEGAIDVTSFINSCSPNAAYTTVGGTADKLAGSVWNNSGPRFNRWFKFTAPSTGQINVTVDIGGVNGTQSRTQIALWQADGITQIASQKYNYNPDDVSIGSLVLTPGNTYYISVDTFDFSTIGTFTFCLQSTVDYDFYEGAIDVTSIINSCSANAAYTTVGGTADKLAGSVWNNSGPRFNRWFKFTAPSTGQINATIDVGSGKGTQTKTQIAIWQADGLTEVTSKCFAQTGEDVSIGSLVLTPGNTYYISVDAFDAGTLGSFTLCLQSTVDYDFYEGAIDVTSFINSCSPNAAYTTVGGTADKLAGSAWNNSGPRFNRWFKFTAPSTGQINVTVDVGSTNGTQTKTQIAIWQADGITQIASQKYAYYTDDVSIGSLVLTPGNTYYISVDSFDYSTMGSFTLCLQSNIDYDFYEGAIDVTSFINSCSPNAAYRTTYGTPDRLAGSVWNNSGPRFNRWFKFTAPSTGQINVTVDIGGAKGTQSSTQIAIWQWDGVTQINSKRYAGIGEDVSIGAFGLTPGSTYYISVDTFNSSTIGSFTLCLQSTIDYDFYEGAIDVTSFINSCSPNASYTTVGGSPDKLAGSNWNNSGPKFNRWFKFTASTAYMNIIVDIGTVTGTQFYTQMALWQSDGITEIASQTYATSVNGPDVSVESSNLIPGNTYYISVDSRSDTSWGTFTLCLNELQLSSDLFLNENNVLLYMNYETLFIKSNISLISKVIVSDIQGRVIYEKGDINNSNFQTDAIKATDQVVLVKIFSQNGSIFTKKIML